MGGRSTKGKQGDTIDRIMAILSRHGGSDTVARITVSSWTWVLLNACGIEHCYIASGFEPGECVPDVAAHCLAIAIDPEQTEAFRLWDREGRECFDTVV